MAHSASLGKVTGALFAAGPGEVREVPLRNTLQVSYNASVSAICKGKLHLQHRFLMPSSCLCHNRSVWLMFIHIKAFLFYCKSDHTGCVIPI